jgi:hypothetical protein
MGRAKKNVGLESVELVALSRNPRQALKIQPKISTFEF